MSNPTAEIVLHLDQKQFKVEATSLTGAEIRALPDPPIGPDRDLYEVVPGPEGDRLIADDGRVALRNGIHFFTAPATISAG